MLQEMVGESPWGCGLVSTGPAAPTYCTAVPTGWGCRELKVSDTVESWVCCYFSCLHAKSKHTQWLITGAELAVVHCCTWEALLPPVLT
jgi:hypothetical protein